MNKNNPIGLDISDLKLRLVQLEKSFKKISVVSFNEVAVPEGYIEDGLIKQVDEVAELIKKLKNKAKGKKVFQKRVVACLPEKQSFIKVIEPADLKEETIKKAAGKEFPFDWKEIYWDWKKTKENGNHNIVIGACKKEIIDSYLATLKKAELIPEVLEIEAQSISRALLDKKDLDPVLIIDIGYARTSLMICYNNAVQFTTSFKSVIDDDQINIQTLNEYINKIVSFYKTHLQGGIDLKKVLLCGSGAYSLETVSLLNDSLEIPVSQGNPWMNLNNHQNKQIKNSLAYTTAIGLALRGLNKDYI